MNKYIFPGADASCALGWVVTQLESAGFEVKNVDVLGVHYSATIDRWYKNWVSNKDKVVEAYGERWYRIWVFFLAYSVIIPRYAVVHFHCIMIFIVSFAPFQTRRHVCFPIHPSQKLERLPPYQRRPEPCLYPRQEGQRAIVSLI